MSNEPNATNTYPGEKKGPFPGMVEPGVPPCPSANDYRSRQNGQDDAVHHPSHYANGRFEVIDIIEDQLKMEGLRGFCLGNTLKYICRAGKKNPEKTLEDLEKAEWYLHHYITRMKETKATNE